MSKIKEWWFALASDTKVLLVVLFFSILAVIYFCGVKGNNQDNFWVREAATEQSLDSPDEE